MSNEVKPKAAALGPDMKDTMPAIKAANKPKRKAKEPKKNTYSSTTPTA